MVPLMSQTVVEMELETSFNHEKDAMVCDDDADSVTTHTTETSLSSSFCSDSSKSRQADSGRRVRFSVSDEDAVLVEKWVFHIDSPPMSPTVSTPCPDSMESVFVRCWYQAVDYIQFRAEAHRLAKHIRKADEKYDAENNHVVSSYQKLLEKFHGYGVSQVSNESLDITLAASDVVDTQSLDEVCPVPLISREYDNLLRWMSAAPGRCGLERYSSVCLSQDKYRRRKLVVQTVLQTQMEHKFAARAAAPPVSPQRRKSGHMADLNSSHHPTSPAANQLMEAALRHASEQLTYPSRYFALQLAHTVGASIQREQREVSVQPPPPPPPQPPQQAQSLSSSSGSTKSSTPRPVATPATAIVIGRGVMVNRSQKLAKRFLSYKSKPAAPAVPVEV
jgi:hypothetical protein